MSDFLKTILKRFARAWLAATLATFAGISWSNPTTFQDLKLALAVLGISAINGVITGFLMAIEKAARFVPADDL